MTPRQQPVAVAPTFLLESLAMDPLFCFLHLSDIHFRHGDAGHQANQELVLARLLEAVESHEGLGIPSPEVILLTGDIAFSGNSKYPDEYAQARRFLSTLCGRLRVPPDQVFMVPGNHDAQRITSGLTWRLLKDLREDPGQAGSLDNALAKDEERRPLEQRFTNYLSFAADYAPACTKMAWSQTFVSRQRFQVRLCGINTALLANDDEDQGKLQVGQMMLRDIGMPSRHWRSVKVSPRGWRVVHGACARGAAGESGPPWWPGAASGAPSPPGTRRAAGDATPSAGAPCDSASAG